MSALPTFDGLHGPALLVALALATLASEDLTCIAAGLLVAVGKLDFLPAVLACFVGILAGDLMLVAVGRWGGRPVLTRWPVRRWVTPAGLTRAEHWFRQRGGRLILASRFMPGTRLATYFAAGILRAPWRRVVGWFILSCALWTPLLVGLAAGLGERTLGWVGTWQKTVPLLLASGLTAWIAVRGLVHLSTWRGRRLALSRWRRLTRWEFWPSWALYPPVVVYLGWLGWRHRSLRVVTAVNPGMGGGGGLIGESKSAILRGLEGGERLAKTAGPRVARWRLLSEGTVAQRAAEVRAFAEGPDGGFPVVLKPDVGERGRGVIIVRRDEDLEPALARSSERLLVQAYVPGVEFGVFYLRRPSEPNGRVFAVTEKRLPDVVGDGRRTLETLILADSRAICQAPLFLERFADRADEVPGPGVRVTLAELGTHCRGALFLDGAEHITPALVEATEACSRRFEGFYFGRYDVRSDSVAAFRQGRFEIIELNGLTSEATSIYDPRHSVVHAWSVLCRQWAWAFAIGAENRSRGARVLSWGELWGLLRGRRNDAAEQTGVGLPAWQARGGQS
ncbi:MAG: VTT domain-containing protein [Opitutaceae bacterium]